MVEGLRELTCTENEEEDREDQRPLPWIGRDGRDFIAPNSELAAQPVAPPSESRHGRRNSKTYPSQ